MASTMTLKTGNMMIQLDAAGLSLCPTSLQARGGVNWPQWMVPQAMVLKVQPGWPTPCISWYENAPLIPSGVRTEECLEALLKISTASDETVLSFAQRWGPTGTECQNRRVLDPGNRAHLSVREEKLWSDSDAAEAEICSQAVVSEDQSFDYALKRTVALMASPDCVINEYYEPLGNYRALARDAMAFLSIAASIGLGRSTILSHPKIEAYWEILLSPYRNRFSELEPHQIPYHLELKQILDAYRPHQPVEAQRKLLVLLVNHRIRNAGCIEPTFVWEGGTPHLAFTYSLASERQGHGLGRLNSLVSLQIASVLLSPSGIAHCERHGCETIYQPKQIRKDRPNYCPSCRLDMDAVYQKRSREKAKERKKAKEATAT